MKIFRTLITPVVIGAVAVAGASATQARADGEDIAKALLALGAIAVIANQIDKNKSSASAGTTVSTRHSNDRVVTLPNTRPQVHRDKHRLRYALPVNCLRTYNAARGERQLFSGRCLSRVDHKLAKLPRDCAYTVRGNRGVIGKAYGPRCMARHGFYQIDDRGRHDRRGRHIVYRGDR